MDTSGFHVADLEDIEFHRENPALNRDAVFRPGIETPFSFSTFQMCSMAEKQLLIDEEKDKENSPPIPTTPMSERRTQPPVLMRSRPFGTKIENVRNI